MNNLDLELKTLKILKEIEKKGDKFYVQTKGKKKEIIKVWRISFEKGLLLHSFVLQNKPKRILELGTSIGYSTLFLADAAKKVKGFVESVEVMEEKVNLATNNIVNAGFGSVAKVHNANIMNFIPTFSKKIGLLFIDANKGQYIDYYNGLKKNLEQGAIIFADNTNKETTNPFKNKVRSELGSGIREYEINFKEDYLVAKRL